MANCFIHGETLLDRNGKQACLKIYRDMDEKELSINFDNSCGSMGNECKRIEACIFKSNNQQDNEPEKTIYVLDSLHLAGIITAFVTGCTLTGNVNHEKEN